MPSRSRSSPGHRHRRRHPWRRRWRRWRNRQSLAPVLILGALAVVGFLLLALSGLAEGRRNLLLARGNLSAARHALSQRDDAGAKRRLDRAQSQVRSARTSASSFPLRVLSSVPLIGSPAQALSAAAKAGTEGVAAGRVMAEASASFPTSASATVDGHDLTAFHNAATRSQEAVEVAGRHLSTAVDALDGPSGALLPVISGPAKAMRAEIEEGRSQLGGLRRGLTLLGDLTSPATDIRLLLLSQDTLELRPTGGFIGSYGVLQFSHGTARLETFQATEDLAQPSPALPGPDVLSGYLHRSWNLGNANWWPDFPKSAAAAADLFRRQGGGEVDGVLAITELATARLIGALGSLKLPSFAQPVVEEGFALRAVYEVELKQPLDVPRKKFLIELSEVFFDRLFNLPAEKLPAVADAVRRSLSAGDIQLWFEDARRQDLLAGTEAAGALPRTDEDFLMLVDANLIASKANLETTKQVDYQVERRPDGRLVGHLRVEVRNDGVASQINPFYNGYLRVYAPAGSELLDSPGNLTVKRLSPDSGYEVFAQPAIVLPKDSKVVTFDYLLPASVGDGGQYRLTWVRQVGTFRDEFGLAVNGRSVEVAPASRSFVFERRAGSK